MHFNGLNAEIANKANKAVQIRPDSLIIIIFI